MDIRQAINWQMNYNTDQHVPIGVQLAERPLGDQLHHAAHRVVGNQHGRIATTAAATTTITATEQRQPHAQPGGPAPMAAVQPPPMGIRSDHCDCFV